MTDSGVHSMDISIEQLRRFMDRFTTALDGLVEGVSLSVRDEVAEYLAQYNDLVPACNVRLQNAAALLARGLRDEALGYESDEPALLEAVTLLDLSGRPRYNAWVDALAANRIPEPALPRIEHAVELRTAQDKLAELKPLLDRWRRENLSGASLATRMKTLRKLREADADNESWYSGLVAFERQRLMDLETDLKSAIASSDEERLQGIVGEFESPWIEKTTSRVEKTARQALASLRGSRVDRELSEVSAGLAAAMEHRDLESARTLRDRWEQLIEAKGTFSVDDANVARAEPAVMWLERHERLEDLFAEVWQSLEARPPLRGHREEWTRSLARMRDEVEDLAEKLTDEIDLEPVERLRDRVARVEQEYEREVGHRRRLMLFSTLASVAAIGAVAFASLSYIRRADQVRKVAAELAGLEERAAAGELVGDAISATEKTWPAWLAADPVVRSRIGQFQSTLAAEDARRERLAAFDRDITPVLEGLAKIAPPAEIGPWPQEFAEASRLLAGVESSALSKSETEKALVAKARGRLEAAAKRLERAGDEVFTLKANDLTSRLAELRGLVAADPAKVRGDLAEVDRAIAELRGAASERAAIGAAPPFDTQTRVSRGVARQVEDGGVLPVSVTELRSKVDLLGRFATQEAKLDDSLGDWPAYATKLKTIAKDFEGLPESKDYGESAANDGVWSGIAEWNRFAATAAPIGSLDADGAKAMKTALAGLGAEARKLEAAAAFIERAGPVIDSIAGRDLDSVGRDIQAWCQREWLTELAWLITEDDPDGAMEYYARDEPRPGRSFKYQREMKQPGGWPPPKTRDTSVDFRTVASPQKQLGDELLALVPRINNASKGLDADEALAGAVNLVMRSDKVEPCVRLVNLRKVLMAGRKVSAAFQADKVNAYVTSIDDGAGGIPGITIADLGEFLDPKRASNPKYLRIKQNAEQYLDRALPVAKAIEGEVGEMSSRAKELRIDTYECVGKVSRGSDGSLRLVPRTGGQQPTKSVEVVVVKADGKEAVVGRTDGKGGLEMSKGASTSAGMPCFVHRPKVVGSRPATSKNRTANGEEAQ